MYLIIVLIIFIAIILYSASESLRLKVTGYRVGHSGIPEGLDNKRLMLLSDLHCVRNFGRNNSRLFDRIRKCAPDLIVIAGDLVNGADETEFVYAQDFIEELHRIGVPVYYAFGNHETKFVFRENDLYSRYVELVNSLPATVLRNSFEEAFGARIYGVELSPGMYKSRYITVEEVSDLNALLGSPDKNYYNILIAHTPEYEKMYFDWGADLVLSGHVHGGIARLPFIGGVISPRMKLFPHHDRGVFTEGGHTLILSAGLGWHGLPFRFNNLPEIVMIELHKTAQ